MGAIPRWFDFLLMPRHTHGEETIVSQAVPDILPVISRGCQSMYSWQDFARHEGKPSAGNNDAVFVEYAVVADKPALVGCIQ